MQGLGCASPGLRRWPWLTPCCLTRPAGTLADSTRATREAPFVTTPCTPASCPRTWTFVRNEATEALRPAQGYTCAPQKCDLLSHKMNFDQREVGAGRYILPSFSPIVRSHMFRRLLRHEPWKIKPSVTLRPQRWLAGWVTMARPCVESHHSPGYGPFP